MPGSSSCDLRSDGEHRAVDRSEGVRHAVRAHEVCEPFGGAATAVDAQHLVGEGQREFPTRLVVDEAAEAQPSPALAARLLGLALAQQAGGDLDRSVHQGVSCHVGLGHGHHRTTVRFLTCRTCPSPNSWRWLRSSRWLPPCSSPQVSGSASRPCPGSR
ncbi:MAG: hypothetical protein WKF58_03760 [Ilumatobacteraceae bacterium]